MGTQEFEIKILRQHWIKDDGKDDKEDLCSHGEVFIKIGDEIIVDGTSNEWTLSVTALYLLRTLERNHEIGDFSNQLVPCCGHFMIPAEDGTNEVTILGCPSGYDWSVTHSGDHIIVKSEKGTTGTLSFEHYKNLVLNFVAEIEHFYGEPELKVLPEDEFDRTAYFQFWNEWRTLTEKWKAGT